MSGDSINDEISHKEDELGMVRRMRKDDPDVQLRPEGKTKSGNWGYVRQYGDGRKESFEMDSKGVMVPGSRRIINPSEDNR